MGDALYQLQEKGQLVYRGEALKGEVMPERCTLAYLAEVGADALSAGEWTFEGQPVERDEIAHAVLRHVADHRPDLLRRLLNEREVPSDGVSDG